MASPWGSSWGNSWGSSWGITVTGDPWGNAWGASWGSSWGRTEFDVRTDDPWGGSWAESWGESWANSGVGAVTVALSGTVIGATEPNIVGGGRTILLTLTGDTWVTLGATFDAVRQDILDGMHAASVQALGWNNTVRDMQPVTAVSRTSDTLVTITLAAAPSYSISSNETVTVTVPASAIETSSAEEVATPTFTIAFVTEVPEPPVDQIPGEGGGGNWDAMDGTQHQPGRRRRKKKSEAVVIRYSDFESQEAYAAALAAAAIPMTAVNEDGTVDEDTEDITDDEILRVLFMTKFIQ